MDDLTIRTAKENDLDRLAEIYRNAYRENRHLGFPAKAENATTDDIEAWMAEGELWVVEVDGTVVGAVRTDQSAPERLKISRLAVHEDRQGHGYATELLDHVEEWAGAQGFSTVWLTTPSDHPYLPTMYRGRGYEKTGDYPLEYRDYDEIVMEKDIPD